VCKMQPLQASLSIQVCLSKLLPSVEKWNTLYDLGLTDGWQWQGAAV
jgi:hypothetical protein